MNILVSVLLLVTLIVVLPPNAEAASVSQTGSWSQSGSFSGTGSGSWSPTQSYSGTAALTLTASGSLTFSGSKAVGVSVSMTMSQSFGAAPPAGLYKFENHCPLQSTSICPFWQPHVFASYRLTVMNSSGFMLTYDNIVVPNLEVPQYPLSYDSTNGFITPGGTYRFQLFGCTAGSCVEAWMPLVVTLNPRRKPVCDPNYLCRVVCKYSSGVVTCNWVNSNTVRLKRAILRVTACYNLNTFTRIALL